MQSVYIVLSDSLTLIKKHIFETFVIFLFIEPRVWSLFVIFSVVRETIEDKIVIQILDVFVF